MENRTNSHSADSSSSSDELSHEPASERGDNEKTAAQWRENLLVQLRVIYYPLLLGAAIAIVAGARTPTLRWYGLFLIFVSVLTIGLLNLKSLSHRTRSICLTGTFVFISATSFILIGTTPGSVLSAAFALVLSALLLGPRHTIAFLGLLILVPLVLTLMVHLQLWGGPSAVEVDPSSSGVWFRMSLVCAAIWTGICLPLLYVVGSVERGLKNSNESLRQLREEQTQRMAAVAAQQEAEQRAFQSQKLESLGRLAAGVAHDFNNALVVIRGWNSIRNESDDPEDHAQAYAAIEEATNQATRLASQLLTFSRQENREPRHLYLDEVIHSVAGALRRLLPAGIELALELNSGGTVFADESQLQQMLINLVINARDALPGGGRIVIRSRRADSPPADETTATGRWLLLEVEDNGVGMSADVQNQAFEPFFTSKSAGDGSGLGLSSVLGIVRQSDGHIELVSEPGLGTTFSVYLPATRAEVAPASVSPTDEMPAEAAGARILVVEDDILANQLVVRTLESAGLEVVSVCDGAEALKTLSDSEPEFDLLCTDAVFPGDSLADVITAFRAHSPQAAILICSGYVPAGLDAQGLQSGDYSFLAKPFRPAELIRHAGRLLTGGKA